MTVEPCPGCDYCIELRLPEFEDEEEMADFFERHEHVDFPDAPKLHPQVELSPSARRQIEEARRRLGLGEAPALHYARERLTVLFERDPVVLGPRAA